MVLTPVTLPRLDTRSHFMTPVFWRCFSILSVALLDHSAHPIPGFTVDIASPIVHPICCCSQYDAAVFDTLKLYGEIIVPNLYLFLNHPSRTFSSPLIFLWYFLALSVHFNVFSSRDLNFAALHRWPRLPFHTVQMFSISVGILSMEVFYWSYHVDQCDSNWCTYVD